MRLRKLLLAGHVVVDRAVIGLAERVAVVGVLGLRLRRAADDVADGVSADLAPGRRGARADVGEVLSPVRRCR